MLSKKTPKKRKPPSEPAPFAEAPRQYRFNDKDQETFANMFWRCPLRRLVMDKRSYTYAVKVKQRNGKVRTKKQTVIFSTMGEMWLRCKAASSVLVVLALHARHNRGAEWSNWWPANFRRIAALAGCDKSTVTKAFKALAAMQLLEYRRMAASDPKQHRRKRFANAHPVEYRLSKVLFPMRIPKWGDGTRYFDDEPCIMLYGNLVYGGWWRFHLWKNHIRHLYLTIGMLSVIAHEQVWGSVYDAVPDPADVVLGADYWRNEQVERIAKKYANSPLSYSQLMTASGIRSRTSIAEALRYMLTGNYEDPADQRLWAEEFAPIKSGATKQAGGRWYALTQVPFENSFKASVLNGYLYGRDESGGNSEAAD